MLNDAPGGLDAIGTAKLENRYHGAWAWAGDTPLLSTKLVAAHFGGTRTPLVISWPGHITPDTTPRSQFHHVNDITPTIYDPLGIPQSEVVDGWPQIPVDGISMQYTFADADAEGQKETQYFEILGSRGVYHDGFMASVLGPRAPWVVGQPDLAGRNSDEDAWELYDLSSPGMWRSKIASTGPIPTGDVQIVVETRVEGQPGTPAEVVVSVGGSDIGRTNVPVTVPLSFSATETLDTGTDVGSPVALGDIARVHIELL